MIKQPLPIDEFLADICDSFQKHTGIIISAAPGAGKTTRVPSALLAQTEKTIWVLEPRRIAAISAANRIAEENNWTLGKEVGYQVRFENKSSKETRILFLTEALLLRKMLKDPQLSQVGCVILDEFHERSIHVDLALGALKELQELDRPDLKIVVMSATLNSEPLSKYLNGVPTIEVPGKAFPLKIIYQEKTQILKTDFEFIARIQKLVQKAALSEPGNILCFLPGRGEIERMRSSLEEWASSQKIGVYPLHGQLNLQEQQEALAPTVSRKIILATNVAESSLTVPGVRIVVDSGLARVQQQNAKSGLESLDLVRISMASAIQRAGRAAREQEGVVYRAWNSFDEKAMEDFEKPEIFRKDLSETILLLSALGVITPENFSWFELPNVKAIATAKDFLKDLGAIDKQGELTSMGRSMRELPLHPRLAKLMILGKQKGFYHLASNLAALLSEGKGSRTSAFSGAENDLVGGLENVKNQRVARQLKEMIGAPSEAENFDERDMAELLLEIYPDRLCRRRRKDEPEAKMVGGRGVKLHPGSSVRSSEFFLAMELSEGREYTGAIVFQAVGLDPKMISEKIASLGNSKVRLEWDKEKQRFWAIEFKEWKGLSVSNEHRRPATHEEVEGQLGDVIWSDWPRLLESNEALDGWFKRMQFLNRHMPEFPMLNDQQIQEAIQAASYGENSILQIQKKNLIPFFETSLTSDHKRTLEKECPQHWTVPTGNKIKVQYSEEQGAFVEVRLQELFGLEKAPVLARQPLTLFLLAPNYRPVQITRDLQSFWANGYSEVRKEMRTRYPKHSWPEDPKTALPQAKGRSTRG